MTADEQPTRQNVDHELSRRRVLQMMAAGAGATALASFLAACGGDTPQNGGDGGSGPAASTAESKGTTAPTGPTGQAVIAQGPEITNLDASMETGMLTFNVAVHMMEPLLMRDEQLRPQPFLAEEITHADNKTIRLTIRQGVKFHNGDPLTVEDVVFTLQRVSGPDSESRHNRYTKSVEAVEAVDERTVEIRLSEPDVTFPGRLALIPVVPKKVVEEMGAEAFDANPVGTGPYKFVSWQRGDRVTLEAFPDYWRELPAIKTLVFRGIAEDATRIAELQTGALDIATNVPTHLVPELEGGDKAQILTTNSLRTLFMILNTHQPPFDDVKVRQAVNFGLDKQLIVDGVLDGYGRPNSQPFGSEVFGYNPELEGFYAYDPDRAKSLLAEAGYADGLEVNFFGPSGRYLKDVEVAQNIASQLAEIGIKVTLNLLEFQAYFDTYIQQLNPEMHLGLWSNANNTADADYNLSLNIHSKGRGLYWNDPEVDRLIDEARQTLDVEEREGIYHDVVRRIVEAAPWVFLYNQVDIYGQATRLKGWTPRPDELIYLYDAIIEG